jgi:hypothetical protein
MKSNSLCQLCSAIEKKGISLKLKINNNRHTFVSVVKEGNSRRLSLHRMFLKAPHHVMRALAHYVIYRRPRLDPLVKAFIEKNKPKLDYSFLLKRSKLITKGKVYDLEKIFRSINKRYFRGELDLAITWFSSRPKARLSLGLYYDTMKLIKIHRTLDSRPVPKCVVEFVVYHEMLHATCPSYIDKSGFHRSHNKEFHRLEGCFRHYEEATKWIREHQMSFFSYGRT